MKPNYIRVAICRREYRLIAAELDRRFDQTVSRLLEAAHTYVDAATGANRSIHPGEALQDLVHAASDMAHAKDARASFARWQWEARHGQA